MNSYADRVSFLPRAMVLRMVARIDATQDAAWGRVKEFFRGIPALWRNVDAVDGLDGRMLRDIGAAGWNAARDARVERDAMRSRLDAEFRG